MFRIQSVPAEAEIGPGRERIAGKEGRALLPVEAEMAGRMAGEVDHLERPDLVPFAQEPVDLAGHVLGHAEHQTELDRIDLERRRAARS